MKSELPSGVSQTPRLASIRRFITDADVRSKAAFASTARHVHRRAWKPGLPPGSAGLGVGHLSVVFIAYKAAAAAGSLGTC